MRSFAPLVLLPLALLACGDDESENKTEDLTQTVNRNGAVESSISVTPLDSGRHVLVTTHKVWVRGAEYKTIAYRDTLPDLGTGPAPVADNESGTPTVNVNKEYEIYITVK